MLAALRPCAPAARRKDYRGCGPRSEEQAYAQLVQRPAHRTAVYTWSYRYNYHAKY